MEDQKLICFECLSNALADTKKTYREIYKSYFMFNETPERHNARLHPEGIDMTAGQQVMEDGEASARYHKFMMWMISSKAEREADADPRG